MHASVNRREVSREILDGRGDGNDLASASLVRDHPARDADCYLRAWVVSFVYVKNIKIKLLVMLYVFYISCVVFMCVLQD